VAENDLVAWHPIAGAEAESRKTGKPLFYDFTAEWCGPCGNLRREVFCDAKSAERINALFIPVRVTDRQSEEGKNPPEVAELQKRYGIEAYPTLVVVPARGGAPQFQRGYGGKESVMAWLESNSTPAKPEKAKRKQSVKRLPK
jgi:thiol:disulfide interchange protein